MSMCAKCSKGMGITVLIVGILFLLKDWGVWNFFNISAWSAIFVLVGMNLWARSCCSDCQSCCCDVPAKKSRK